MSKLGFDRVFSGLSHDGLLDQQWTEVHVAAEARALYKSQAALWSLVDILQDLYWTGVERELAAAIIAFDDIQTIHPEETAEEKREVANMEGLLLDTEKDQIINEWLNIWCTFKSSHKMILF
jgi:hypothetical protein